MDNFDFTSFANMLADEAGIISRQYYGQKLDIITKGDDSPVTIADRAIETRLRDIVELERPQDGILGEEFGEKESRSGYTWVFDPIDGTKSFTIGRPTFGNLIGLCFEDKPILGIINQPILNERWVGQSEQKTTFNGNVVSCRQCQTLKDAIFGVGAPSQINDGDPARFSRLEKATRYPVFQGDCYFYGLMANGMLDILVEDHLGIYDFIALVPIIEVAGGKVTDWQGNPKTLHGNPQLVATGDPARHDEILALIS